VGYIDAVPTHLPRTELVFDRWHVTRPIVTVRPQAWRAMSGPERTRGPAVRTDTMIDDAWHVGVGRRLRTSRPWPNGSPTTARSASQRRAR